MESGTITAETVNLTNNELHEFAVGIMAGTHVASWLIPSQDASVLTSVFMPFTFMDEIALKNFSAKFAHVVGRPSDRMGSSINGYPIHLGMTGITQADANKIMEKIKLLETI